MEHLVTWQGKNEQVRWEKWKIDIDKPGKRHLCGKLAYPVFFSCKSLCFMWHMRGMTFIFMSRLFVLDAQNELQLLNTEGNVCEIYIMRDMYTSRDPAHLWPNFPSWTLIERRVTTLFSIIDDAARKYHDVSHRSLTINALAHCARIDACIGAIKQIKKLKKRRPRPERWATRHVNSWSE